MMDVKKLTGRAKELVDKRGGPEGLKQDAANLLGALSDKAKHAAERLRESSGKGSEHEPPAPEHEGTASEPERPASTQRPGEAGGRAQEDELPAPEQGPSGAVPANSEAGPSGAPIEPDRDVTEPERRPRPEPPSAA